jgi:hypothetical protein
LYCLTGNWRGKHMTKWFVLFWVLAASGLCLAQSESATLSGRVSDSSGAAVVGAEVVLTNTQTNAEQRTKTNGVGLYVFADVHPGAYRVAAGAPGFRVLIKEGLILHVQDELAENFSLTLGAISESITVTADQNNINTTDASVSTVIDQTYVENMPLNGRSFQDLILLTPGTVTQNPQTNSINGIGSGVGVTGEFSVNGQRSESNYYTVDGVSANIGASTGNGMYLGAGASGSLPGATALGTTQGLVSVDDLQEFRVQSSTYSAEYGRNPGGQFAFETKSGANQSHGTAYDYLRNGYVDAQDWFNDYLGVKEPAVRQNDFGGTLGGPVEVPGLYSGKDKTFFFVSYEGLRLSQPQSANVNYVPNLCLRGESGSCTGTDTPAPAALQPVLNAFPVPNGPDVGSGLAEYFAGWSNPSSLDSTSVRFDHVLNEKLRLFFRFSDTGSYTTARGTGGFSPTTNTTSAYTTRTYTTGASGLFTSRVSNEFRLNYSSNAAANSTLMDSFGGSTFVSLRQLLGTSSGATVDILFLGGPGVAALAESSQSGSQTQWNLVDTVSLSFGRHQSKFGVDYRRLTPTAMPVSPQFQYLYFGESAVEANLAFANAEIFAPTYPLYMNFSAFAQDDWKASQRLSLSMGLRWDVNPAPGVTKGLKPYTVDFVSSDPNTWTLAPEGTPLWQTAWFNFAPRLGAAYLFRNSRGWETVVRGGGGIFFDTGQQEGSLGYNDGPGFSSSTGFQLIPFPTSAVIPPITNPPTAPYAGLFGYPRHLQLPYSVQWNATIEQALGKSQALTVSYVGSHGARLLEDSAIQTPKNPNTSQFEIVKNGLTSDYNSLQLQVRRRLSRGLMALASYTWSHCVDYGSQNYFLGYQRGNCDFDIRHNFSAAFSYDLPDVGQNRFYNALLHHWGLDDRVTARTGFPVTLQGNTTFDPVTNQEYYGGLDLVPGQSVYLYGANCASVLQGLGDLQPGQECPGGRAVNPNAFALPPVDPNTGNPTGPGNAPRNFVRGFGAWQMDMAVRREFPIHEGLKLQFRAEAFNIFNHPNFGAVDSLFGDVRFGQFTGTLASTLGVMSPLYQMGGPRSMQFALKLTF